MLVVFFASTFRLVSFGTSSLQKAFLFDRPTRPLIWCRSDNPNICAWFIIIVFAFGMSMPDSIIFVETRTSNLPSTKFKIVFSNKSPLSCP